MRTELRKRNTRKRNIIIATSFLFLVGLSILISFFMYKNIQSKKDEEFKTASKVAENFTNTIKNQNFEALPKLVTKQSLKNNEYTEDELISKYDNIFSGIEASKITISDVSVTKKEEDELDYKFSYKLTMNTSLGPLDEQNYSGVISKEHEEWKINWKPNLIFPTMKKDDSIKITTDKASRGQILDKNGLSLATFKQFPEVGMIPGKLGTGKEKEQKIKEISKLLDISEENIQKKLAQKWVRDDSYVPLKLVDKITDKMTSIEGIGYSKKEIRFYPYNEATAHITGYVGEVSAEDIKKNPSLKALDIIGKSGLEYAFDKELRGTDGGEIIIVNTTTDGTTSLQKLDKKDGANIKLTIDADLQLLVYNNMKKEVGAVTIMHPETGELLALVSTPSYDVNLFTQGISSENYRKYSESKDFPFLARYANRYAPGSTFKTITAAIGLETGVTKKDKIRQITGLQWQKDSSWGNYSITRVKSANEVSMVNALVYSDNIYFGQEALEIGKDRYVKELKKFGFDEELDFPFTMKKPQISNNKINSEILLADTAYGQGELLLSPIQQAFAYSPFASGGKLVYPKLVINQKVPEPKQIMKKESANIVKNALVEVVENPQGTARGLRINGQSIAAKTGTAELKKKQGEEGLENGFLLAFDSKNSNYLLVGMIEDVKGRGGSGLVIEKMKPVIESFYLQ